MGEFPHSFPWFLLTEVCSSAQEGSPGFTRVSWAPLLALTFRYCPQHLSAHRDISQTHMTVPRHVQSRMSSPHLSTYGQIWIFLHLPPQSLYLGTVRAVPVAVSCGLPSSSSPGTNPALRCRSLHMQSRSSNAKVAPSWRGFPSATSTFHPTTAA